MQVLVFKTFSSARLLQKGGENQSWRFCPAPHPGVQDIWLLVKRHKYKVHHVSRCNVFWNQVTAGDRDSPALFLWGEHAYNYLVFSLEATLGGKSIFYFQFYIKYLFMQPQSSNNTHTKQNNSPSPAGWFQSQRSIWGFNVYTLNIQGWTLDVKGSTLDVKCSVFKIRYQTFNIRF